MVEPKNEALEAGNYMNIAGSYAKGGTESCGILIYVDTKDQSGPQTWILRSENSMQNAVFPGRIPVLLFYTLNYSYR
jgi:hypothetical protein